MSRMVIVLVALVLVCRSAIADESEAKSLFTRGRTAYALGRFNDAADLFEKAFELKQDPAILYNAAQAHRLAGNKPKALVLYQNYLRLFGEQTNSSEVERRIGELKTAIEAEQAAKTNPPTGLLNDKGEPPASAASAPRSTASPPTASPLLATQAALPPKKPLARRGWFWSVVVGGAAVVGGAVALGVVLGTAKSGPAITLGSVKGN